VVNVTVKATLDGVLTLAKVGFAGVESAAPDAILKRITAAITHLQVDARNLEIWPQQ
jgi:hypothetical protein